MGLVYIPWVNTEKPLLTVKKNNMKKLFKDYFLKSFSGRLVGYTDAKIAVLSEEIKK